MGIKYAAFAPAAEAVKKHREGHAFLREETAPALGELNMLCRDKGDLFFLKTPEGGERQQAMRWAMTKSFEKHKVPDQLRNVHAIFSKVCQAKCVFEEMGTTTNESPSAARKRKKRLAWVEDLFRNLVDYGEWLNDQKTAAK